ncbi:hypothetical protein B0H63DRAFT_457267 [Podospora didyma]|uniref:Uncharacterized protein n=1 Tax=Podospora didyma TaxID=330526 RepID=A0AAE0P4A0_9PEZI|nr:hypothetical protein B0H63DRAFT_457267 [Podospora didyma]
MMQTALRCFRPQYTVVNAFIPAALRGSTRRNISLEYGRESGNSPYYQNGKPGNATRSRNTKPNYQGNKSNSYNNDAPLEGAGQWTLGGSSPRVQAMAARLNIGHSNEPKLVEGQKKTSPIRVSVSKRHTFSAFHRRYLEEEHSITAMFIDIYEAKAKEKLWIWVYPNSAEDGSKAIARSMSQKRARNIVFCALKANGFNRHGRSLEKSDRDLYGTLKLHVTSPEQLLLEDIGEAKKYMTDLIRDKVVPKLLTDSWANYQPAARR